VRRSGDQQRGDLPRPAAVIASGDDDIDDAGRFGVLFCDHRQSLLIPMGPRATSERSGDATTPFPPGMEWKTDAMSE
jgi:hypothetical protein